MKVGSRGFVIFIGSSESKWGLATSTEKVEG